MRGVLLILLYWVVLSHGNFTRDDSTSESNGLTKIKLNKCFCFEEEVFISSANRCKPHETSLKVYPATVYKTSEFADVTIRNIECPHGTTTKILAENVILLEDGRLYDHVNFKAYQPDEFCFEHVYFEENQLIRFIVKFCEDISVPIIPQCCALGTVRDLHNNCILSENFIFAPPFLQNRTWDIEEETINNVTCDIGYRVMSVDITHNSDGFFLTKSKNGSTLSALPYQFNNYFFNSSEFCVAAVPTKDYEFKYVADICEPNPEELHRLHCRNQSCIRKCCGNGLAYDSKFKICRQSDIDLQSSVQYLDLRDYYIINGQPLCESYFLLDKEEVRSNITAEGYLYVSEMDTYYSPAEYCIDALKSDVNSSIITFVCDTSSSECSWEITIEILTFGTSAVFLTVTFIVYASIEDLRTKLVGKCLMAEIFALLVSYISILIIKTGILNNRNASTLCQVTGVLQHISTLASFFWLNVMCYDMWSSMRNMTDIGKKRKQHTKRYILYSLYGWGSPIFIGVVGVALDSLDNESLITPQFGQRSCSFAERQSIWTYLYSFIVFILIVNTLFFLHVTIIIFRTQRQSHKVLTSSSKSSKKISHEKFWLYLKLFIVMGITWASEITSYEFDAFSYSCLYWLPFNIINGLRGVSIFAIFVWKKPTLDKIRQFFSKLNLVPKKRTSFNDKMGRKKMASVNTSGISANSSLADNRKSSTKSEGRSKETNPENISIPVSQSTKEVIELSTIEEDRYITSL